MAPAFGRGGGVDDRTAYADAPVPIGPRATISAPHMHGRCLELLAPPLLAKAQAKVLDVGSGSGYLTAAFALLGPGIEAYGVDRDAGLVQLSIKNVAKDNLLQKELGDRIKFERRDGWAGLPDYGPIAHVGAGARRSAALDQPTQGSRMIILGWRERGPPVVDRDSAGRSCKGVGRGALRGPGRARIDDEGPFCVRTGEPKALPVDGVGVKRDARVCVA